MNLTEKPRYEILDGLRGVAAIMVVAFHLFETYSAGLPFQIINHGYLAVDFFFVLSGFVIGYAYDDRWSRMTTWQFCKRRLIRLHPMLIFGTLIGLLLFYTGGDHPDFAMIGSVPVGRLMVVFLICITLFPLPQSMDIRGWGEMNPLNGATWTLFWEYLANLAYALVVRRFTKLLLSIFVAIAAVFTVVLCMDIDIFGVLVRRAEARYTVVGGWSLSADQVQIGLTRLCYPFFCGLLLSRLRWTLRVKGAFWWCAVAVAVVLAMPRIGGAIEANYWMNGLYEAVCILLVFPLIVVVGAGSSTRGGTSRINQFLGNISYPLYVTHYPLIYWQMSWAAAHQDLPMSTHIFVGIAVFIGAISIAYASYKMYDLPIRSWLKRRLIDR